MQDFWAELIGTAVLILLGNGVVANVVLSKSKGNSSGWIVITTGWGMAVAMAVYCVGRVSGAHINPAVTIALASVGAFAWSKVPLYVAAQMLGAMVGAVLVWLTYLPHWKETEDEAGKLACFCTAPEIRDTAANCLCEFIGTAMLLFGVMAIGANGTAIAGASEIDLSSIFNTGLAPLLVGFLVWSIGLSLGGPTGYAINPARDLGPRIAHALLPIAGKGGSDWSYSWIPVLAPVAGGVTGAWLYTLVGF